MNPARSVQNRGPADAGALEDSAPAVLRHLAELRGQSFTEAEYQEQRQIVLAELAQGARLRPFTWFTFIVVELGLAGLLIVGLLAGSRSEPRDYTLAIVSGTALLCGGLVLLQLSRAVSRDRVRSLQERLHELEELRGQQLITLDEYHHLQSHILGGRQRAP